MSTTDHEQRWDVVILGGALAGASTACLLRQRNPRWRILIIEKSEQLGRRVGESTVETSAYFLGRVLGLTEHLNDRHLVKQGMRFWFANADTHGLTDCSEMGPRYNVRFPGYQVDRAILDEEVLARAVAAGAELLRPVRVRAVTLSPGGRQTVEWEGADGRAGTATARWVVDASGVAALLARHHGWLQTNTAHPIAACWSRWRGVKNLDAPEWSDRQASYGTRSAAVRYTATNHICGKGWWAWFIPLKGGETSVGVVYDQRLTELPEGDRMGDRLRAFLEAHPAARDLLAAATFQEGDVHFRRQCAYRSTRFAGDGFVLVGDAAAFMDPFYSPGMDWISFSASAAAALVDSCLSGRSAAERVERHNRLFACSYDRWFDAVYRDKYYYMGDQELMTLAFRLDLGLYYLGVVARPFREGRVGLEIPAFALRGAGAAAALMALYNRRLVAMAKSRLARGVWGRRNQGRYFGFISYELNRRLPWRVAAALGSWLGLELREGWRTWFALRSGVPVEPLVAPPVPAKVSGFG
jgi:flavin-dependent dehydrogenase